MKKKSFLDEDNTFTRGVKRGAFWASFVKNNKRTLWIVRVVFFGLLLLLLVRGCF